MGAYQSILKPAAESAGYTVRRADTEQMPRNMEKIAEKNEARIAPVQNKPASNSEQVAGTSAVVHDLVNGSAPSSPATP